MLLELTKLPAAKSPFTVQQVRPSKDLPSTTASNNSHSWTGITSKHFGSGGAVVSAVAAGSPAAKVGLRPGDVINAVNGISLRDEDLDKKARVDGSARLHAGLVGL